MIRNQQYDVCVRKNEGFCRLQIRESTRTTDSFELESNTADAKSHVSTIEYNKETSCRKNMF